MGYGSGWKVEERSPGAEQKGKRPVSTLVCVTVAVSGEGALAVWESVRAQGGLALLQGQRASPQLPGHGSPQPVSAYKTEGEKKASPSYIKVILQFSPSTALTFPGEGNRRTSELILVLEAAHLTPVIMAVVIAPAASLGCLWALFPDRAPLFPYTGNIPGAQCPLH